MTTPPVPTPIYRIIHIDCLSTLLRRSALHAPNHVPEDGLPYVGIHATQTQADRGGLPVGCGPRGTISDYVGFYFGALSPMLLRIKTGSGVAKHDQADIIYLVATAQTVSQAGLGFVFYNGHSLAAYSKAYSSLDDLEEVDWEAVRLKYWKSTIEDPDRKRRKQAEFLVFREMDWSLVDEIGVFNQAAREKVEEQLTAFAHRHQPRVALRPSWYYRGE